MGYYLKTNKLITCWNSFPSDFHERISGIELERIRYSSIYETSISQTWLLFVTLIFSLTINDIADCVQMMETKKLFL